MKIVNTLSGVILLTLSYNISSYAACSANIDLGTKDIINAGNITLSGNVSSATLAISGKSVLGTTTIGSTVSKKNLTVFGLVVATSGLTLGSTVGLTQHTLCRAKEPLIQS